MTIRGLIAWVCYNKLKELKYNKINNIKRDILLFIIIKTTNLLEIIKINKNITYFI